MLPQASFLFAQVLRRGHTIYSHCNAGVGRSVAAACGFLTFALGLSLRQMQYVTVAQQRLWRISQVLVYRVYLHLFAKSR